MTVAADIVDYTIQNTQTHLLQLRRPGGHWQGHVTSSALTTATAVFALATIDRQLYQNLIEGGLQWLMDHQNQDGGWGDTPKSQSRLTTTLLCYSALTVSDGSFTYNETVSRTEAWIERTVGSLHVTDVTRAILARQSHPQCVCSAVMMMCALAKRLSPKATVWRYVRPPSFRPSVRSQAIQNVDFDVPLQIALRLVHRHCHKGYPPGKQGRSGNALKKGMALLERLQADNGAFSGSLTSTAFVLMNLAALGDGHHRIIAQGASYLVDSVRDDGSWPGEMPLCVRTTSLSLSALAAAEPPFSDAYKNELNITRDWLLTLQETLTHPVTCAAPGGWSMNDLPGSLPNAYDTAETMIALSHLDTEGRRTQSAAVNAVQWLLDLQNKNGGFSLFGTGRASQPQKQSCPDITAHVLGAMGCWFYRWPIRLQKQIHKSLQRAVTYLKDRQNSQGYWLPLWYGFEIESLPRRANPVYGTSSILSHLALLPQAYTQRMSVELTQAAEWLLSVQHENGAWGSDSDCPPSIEETALAVNALATTLTDHDLPLFDTQIKAMEKALRRGETWLIEHTENGTAFDPLLIGLSFTGHGYCEELYPVTFTLAALQKASLALV